MLPNACPKPVSKPKAPKGLRAVNKARAKENDARAYGPPARRKLVSLGPCQACGAEVLCDNAHLLGNDGMGRKQGYKTIGSLCRPRPATAREVEMHFVSGDAMWPGCHYVFDEMPEKFAAIFPTFRPKKAARETERRWQQFLKGQSSSPEGTR